MKPEIPEITPAICAIVMKRPYTIRVGQTTFLKGFTFHNRFQWVIDRHHPSLYGALLEIQREQADTETMVTQLELGQKVKAPPKKTGLITQRRIRNIVATFAENINEAGD